MMGVPIYFAIGFILTTLLVVVISWYNEGDNYSDTYFMAGVVGVGTALSWPIIIPLAMFGGLAWYVSENMGRNT